MEVIYSAKKVEHINEYLFIDTSVLFKTSRYMK